MIKETPPLELRHELKYFINEGDAAMLARMMDHVLWRDSNADENGEYHIRSLYFDDMTNSAYYDKINGVRDRDKYRIRIYNFSDRVIRLERKRKRGDLINKSSAQISSDLCAQIISGDTSGLEKANSQLLRELFLQMTTHMLAPAVIVDYVRQAFVHPAENTRVTLDKQLRSGLFGKDMHSLFNPNLPTVPPLDAPQTILEIKYDRRLPDMIPGLIACAQCTRSAISKYTLCRRYEF